MKRVKKSEQFVHVGQRAYVVDDVDCAIHQTSVVGGTALRVFVADHGESCPCFASYKDAREYASDLLRLRISMNKESVRRYLEDSRKVISNLECKLAELPAEVSIVLTETHGPTLPIPRFTVGELVYVANLNYPSRYPFEAPLVSVVAVTISAVGSVNKSALFVYGNVSNNELYMPEERMFRDVISARRCAQAMFRDNTNGTIKLSNIPVIQEVSQGANVAT